MARKWDADIPADLDLPSSWVVSLTALDATSGALVTGVNVSNLVIVGTPVTPDTTDSEPLFVPTTPLWLPVPVDSGA